MKPRTGEYEGAGPTPGESAAAWAEGVARSDPPPPPLPHSYHRPSGRLNLLGATVWLLATILLALTAIALSGGIETIEAIQ